MSSTVADFGRKVTRQDIATALYSLSALPKRVAVDPEIEFASYVLALEGVPAFALTNAVQAIIRNALGHAFFPAPPELRGVVDRIWNAEIEQQARERHRKSLAEEAASWRSVEHSPASIARVQALVKRFHDSLRGTSEEAEVAAIRAKYDPALLAQIPDRPLKSFTRPEVRP